MVDGNPRDRWLSQAPIRGMQMAQDSSLADRATIIAAGLVSNPQFIRSLKGVSAAEISQKAVEVAKAIDAAVVDASGEPRSS